MKAGVYKIVHIATGRCYVGSSVNIRLRWGQHRRDLNAGKHHSVKLQRSWAKYGADAFDFSVIEHLSDVAALLIREQFWIDAMQAATRRNFNCQPTAGSPLGMKHRAESKQRMSEMRKGVKKSPIHVEKVAAANRGQVRSDETRKLLSGLHTGRKHSASSKANMKAAQATKTMSEESRQRMVTANVGRTFPEEHRARISDALKGRKLSEETKKKISEARKRHAAKNSASH